MAFLLDYDSPNALKAFLEERNLAMQKKFGQNFLINSRARKSLIDSLDIEEGTTVWEIGPGLGAMTSEILNRGAELTAFEIDHGFSAVLKELFADKTNFKLIEGDVLKTWKTVNDKPMRLLEICLIILQQQYLQILFAPAFVLTNL